MAKNKRSPKPGGEKVNKSAAIRAELEKNPSAKPSQVVKALAEKGIQVSPTFVSVVKSKDGKRAGSTKRGPRAKGKRRRAPGRNGTPMHLHEADRNYVSWLKGIKASLESQLAAVGRRLTAFARSER